MAISSAGVGSGLDVESLIAKLVAVERQPITALSTRQQSYKDQLSAYGKLLSAATSLQTATAAIDTASDFKGYAATVADTDYASATASSSAASGTFSLNVAKLAKANKLQSSGDPVISAGTIDIEIGDISTPPFVRKSGTSKVTVNFTGSTLAELRTAINDADAGVTASIVAGADGKKYLILTSNETGVDSTIKLSGATGGLTTLNYDPEAPGAAFTQIDAAQNAEAYIDGLKVSGTSNTITDAITGVNVTLKKTHALLTDTTTVTVGPDTAGMQTKAENLIKAWNDFNSLVKSLTKYDATTKKGSTLTGDSTVVSMANRLRDTLFSSPTGVSTAYPRLSDLGITLQTDGSLKLDSSKFGTAVSANLSAVTDTMTAFGAAFKTLADSYVNSTGVISTKTSSLTTSISAFDKRIAALELQVTAIEKRYRAQYSALDALMGRLQTQSTYLSQQLSRLS